jgi:hypothetical protein
MVLTGLWESVWFDKVALPVVLGIATHGLLTFIPRMVGNSRSSIGRMRGRSLIKKANVFIGSQSQNRTDTLMLMMMGHLLIRCTVFIAALVATFAFYILSFLDKDLGIGIPVLFMACFCGVVMHLVTNTWNDVSDIAIASMGPEKYLDRLDAKLGPKGREEFKDDLVVLRKLAAEIWRLRRGSIAMATIADGLVYERSGSREAAPSNPTDHPI